MNRLYETYNAYAAYKRHITVKNRKRFRALEKTLNDKEKEQFINLKDLYRLIILRPIKI